jgi:pimeloyl-ACP methyl ester carboxylesterase
MPNLVFLPGAGGRAAFWKPVADLLSDLGPAHLLAYPGFGDVPADPALRSLDDLYRWVLARLPSGRCHLVAQSMGGVLAARLAIEVPGRVDRIVLCATSGGTDVGRLGAAEWRDEFRAARPDVPPWFEDDRTDLTERLGSIRAPTLLLWSDVDPVSPLAVGRFLKARIPGARLETIAAGSHGFASERPEEVAPRIRGHLAGASSARRGTS